VQHAASAITAPDTGQLPAYWQFHEAVTRAQLTEWLPTGRHLLVDVSGPRGPGAELAAKAGHTVLRVMDPARGVWGGGQPSHERGGLGGSPPRLTEPLTDSEARILRYLPTHLTAQEIARELSLSVHTVTTHMRHLYAKLGVHRRRQAVEHARALDLLAPAPWGSSGTQAGRESTASPRRITS